MAVLAVSSGLTRVAENSPLSELEENTENAGWYCKLFLIQVLINCKTSGKKSRFSRCVSHLA